MIHPFRRHLWLAGSVVSISLLGACAPEEEGLENAQAPETHTVGQELSAGTELRNLEVSLSADQSAFGAAESALVKVTLRNTRSKSVKLLKWFTPADGLEESLFVVARDGKALAFEGPHYKRPAVTAEDYLTLAPGESQTWTVDLSEGYDLSKTGDYSLRFAVGPLSSNSLKLSIEGRASANRQPSEPISTTSTVSFTNCDATQQPLALQAVSNASLYANGASTYLNGTPSATPRYTTWFGTYSSSGWSTAQSHFAAIKDAFDTKPITIDCGCRKKYYAYVYPNQPYKIYVCSVFWQAPATGTDSKAGTLIHEMSHFTVTSGTDDWAYGQTNAKALAISDPTKALDNADSHEYFAENTPAQQ